MVNNNGVVKISSVVCLWLLSFVFRDWLLGLLCHAYPITETVPDNSWLVQIALIIIILIPYIIGFRECSGSQLLFPRRLAIVLSIIAFYLLFRFSDKIYFHHAPGLCLGYLDICLIFISSLEFCFLLSRFIGRKKSRHSVETAIPFFYDTPAQLDKLNRTNHARVLVNKIAATLSEAEIDTSFCILLNEQYGAGKTSFFNMLKRESEAIRLDFIEFRPWLSPSSASMMQEFLILLESKLLLSDSALSDDIIAYAKALSGIQIGIVEFAFKGNFRTRSITDRREDISKKMKLLRHPILVLVDDVDRLHSEELLALLQLIRNTADFPYLCYILAADKEFIAKILKRKGIVDTDLFLHKFFNLELSFPPDDNYLEKLLDEQLESILGKYNVDYDLVQSCKQSLHAIDGIGDVLSTPRDIYRYFNLLTYSLDLLLEHNVFEEVNKIDVILITLVQFISPKWYKILRDRDDYLLEYDSMNGRLLINRSKIEALYPRHIKQALKEVEKRHTKLDLEQTKAVAPTMYSIEKEAEKDSLEALKGILYELFGSSSDTKSAERICFKDEYFKYFAGHYKEDEITSSEAFQALNSSLASFTEAVSLMKVAKKKSCLHKILLFIEENRILDRVDILKKVMILSDSIYSEETASLTVKYQYSPEKQIVSRLFLTEDKAEEPLDDQKRQEKDELLELLSKDIRYPHLTLILSTMGRLRGYHFVYGDHLSLRMKEFLVDRFIREELKTGPFESQSLDSIPYFRAMYQVYWEDSFQKFVQSSDCPMEWIYRFITVNSEGAIAWDDKYINQIAGSKSFNLKQYTVNLIGEALPSAIMQDMGTLTVGDSNINLTEEDHPFINAAMQWHRQRLMSR